MSSTPVSPEANRLMPSETTFRASTSRPESVSSRMATFGLSSSSWRISCRVFSPPEKPSFRLRCPKAGSMASASIASFISLENWRSFGASPRTAVTAERRKFDTDTPGTSTGYCMARNSPARARSSTDMARTSSPSRVTLPDVTSYLGCPAIAYARVDFPEPFGPMIAWVSPAFTVRSTPRRISFVPSEPTPTETWRSRISSVAIMLVVPSSWVLVAGGERHVHVAGLDLGLVGGDRLRGRRVGGLAAAQVEAGPVQPALDGAVVDLSLGEGHLGVRADVVEGEDVRAAAHDGDERVVDLDGDGPVRGDVVQRAHLHVLAPGGRAPGLPGPRGLAHRASPRSSSSSIASMTLSRTSSTSMRSISWPRKPRTTMRRASSWGMPRAWR